MKLIEKLVWDSNFFGLNIGRSYINHGQSFSSNDFLMEARSAYDLIYVFSNQMLAKNIVDEINLELADIMITLSQPLELTNNQNVAYSLKTKLSGKEMDECYEIAEQTSEVSRFYSEPLIGHGKARELYRKWIDNAINNKFADGILIAKTEDTIAGIHVVKTIKEENTGLCSLIGVSPKFKGLGIGRNLWNQAFNYWNELGSITKCKVPFSIKNSESFNFHLKIGFDKVEEIKYIYHYRNKN